MSSRLCARGVRWAVVAAAIAFLVWPALGGTRVAHAAAPPSPLTTPAPGEPWWAPVGLRGNRVTEVRPTSGGIAVTADDSRLLSTDGGAHFSPLPAGCCTTPPSGATAKRWSIKAGAVMVSSGGAAFVPDPGAPDLGAGAHLIASPASNSDVVVAVDTGGTVWRRRPDGSWGRALHLLPQVLAWGTPTITAVAAFTEPLSDSVYLATDGYSVLLTTDGGDDWLRDGPGLPDHVLALATDASAGAIYAGTDDGLWVHHLRALPSAPSYPGPDLLIRWLGIVAITAAAIVLGAGALVLALR